jgi:hypothetical protein
MLSARESDYLLADLCVQLGFCLPPDAQEELRDRSPTDPDSFATAVFRAEGLDPLSDRQLYRQVREMVSAAFARAQSHGSAAFDRVLAAVLPLYTEHGLRLVDARDDPQAFGSRYVTFGDASRHLRLTWDGKEKWFTLEVDEEPGKTKWEGWIDLTLQRFDPAEATDRWIEEIIEDVRGALTDYLGAGHTGSQDSPAV